LSKEKHLLLLSKHYEGIEGPVRESLVNWEISIGDYVLINSTLVSAILMDAIIG
jgi:tRNA (guanine37-N1)-methyltransferase